jgi:hypothetical protein
MLTPGEMVELRGQMQTPAWAAVLVTLDKNEKRASLAKDRLGFEVAAACDYNLGAEVCTLSPLIVLLCIPYMFTYMIQLYTKDPFYVHGLLVFARYDTIMLQLMYTI